MSDKNIQIVKDIYAAFSRGEGMSRLFVENGEAVAAIG